MIDDVISPCSRGLSLRMPEFSTIATSAVASFPRSAALSVALPFGSSVPLRFSRTFPVDQAHRSQWA